MLTDSALVVDDVQLAVVPPFVGRGEHLHHVGRRDAGAQQVEAVPAVVGIDERLGAEGAHAAFGVRAEGAHREESRSDRHAERAALVAGDDRPGHGRG